MNDLIIGAIAGFLFGLAIAAIRWQADYQKIERLESNCRRSAESAERWRRMFDGEVERNKTLVIEKRDVSTRLNEARSLYKLIEVRNGIGHSGSTLGDQTPAE